SVIAATDCAAAGWTGARRLRYVTRHARRFDGAAELGRPLGGGHGGQLRTVRQLRRQRAACGAGRHDVGPVARPPDGAARGRLAPDRALHRRIHRDRPRTPGVLHVHGRGPAVLRRSPGREDDDPGARAGAHRPRAGGPGGREHRGRAGDDEGDGADRRAGDARVRSAGLPGRAARAGRADHVPDRGGVRQRDGHPGRLGDRAQPAGPLHARVRAGPAAVLPAVRRAVLTDQGDVVRAGGHGAGLLLRLQDDGRCGGRGPGHDTRRGGRQHDDPGAGRVLGGRPAMSIQLLDVRKAFGEKVVLRGVSLEVREGETVAIIGGSGSGKSVLLKTIVGLLPPDGGQVLVDGQDVATLRRHELYELRRRVGYVFQFAALFDSMTVADNVAMGLRRVPGMSAADIEERVQESLRLVDLEGYGERYPAELSGGQRKRAGLARAIATRPKYVLYDEPTTGLDPVTTALIDRLILK